MDAGDVPVRRDSVERLFNRTLNSSELFSIKALI